MSITRCVSIGLKVLRALWSCHSKSITINPHQENFRFTQKLHNFLDEARAISVSFGGPSAIQGALNINSNFSSKLHRSLKYTGLLIKVNYLGQNKNTSDVYFQRKNNGIFYPSASVLRSFTIKKDNFAKDNGKAPLQCSRLKIEGCSGSGLILYPSTLFSAKRFFW